MEGRPAVNHSCLKPRSRSLSYPLIKRKIERIDKECRSIKSAIFAKLSTRKIALGYYNYPNFGDQLSPQILQYFGLQPLWTPNFRYADTLGVGSILNKAPKEFAGAVLGSGFLSLDLAKALPNAKVHLVRGHKTLELLRYDMEVPVGDPGLICDVVYRDQIRSA